MTYSDNISTSLTEAPKGFVLCGFHNKVRIFRKRFNDHQSAKHFANMVKHGSQVNIIDDRITVVYQ